MTLHKKQSVEERVKAFVRDYTTLARRIDNYVDVRQMTNSLKENLGHGGFSCVYKLRKATRWPFSGSEGTERIERKWR